jgi:hypothetical protein
MAPVSASGGDRRASARAVDLAPEAAEPAVEDVSPQKARLDAPLPELLPGLEQG